MCKVCCDPGGMLFETLGGPQDDKPFKQINRTLKLEQNSIKWLHTHPHTHTQGRTDGRTDGQNKDLRTYAASCQDQQQTKIENLHNDGPRRRRSPRPPPPTTTEKSSTSSKTEATTMVRSRSRRNRNSRSRISRNC